MRTTWSGLWKNADFLRLWSGQTISVFGSMIGGTAMSFTAILALNASPFQMGVLHAMELLPAFLIGLLAGIGFTMSIFIALLAFADAHLLGAAKLGVLVGSVIAALLGLGWGAVYARHRR